MSTSEAISMSDFGRGGGKGAKAAISLTALGSPCWCSAGSERVAMVVPVWTCGAERTATVVPVSASSSRPLCRSAARSRSSEGRAPARSRPPRSAPPAPSLVRPAGCVSEIVVAGAGTLHARGGLRLRHDEGMNARVIGIGSESRDLRRLARAGGARERPAARRDRRILVLIRSAEKRRPQALVLAAADRSASP